MTKGRNPASRIAVRSLSVLAVDDDSLVLSVVDLMLRGAGHCVRTVASGQEALDALAESRFDLVLSDVRMPGMDGVELSRRIRAAYPLLPVILMTGYLSEQSIGTARKIGVEHVVSKPFKSAQLLALITRVVTSAS
jgi:CheY-like chemotaxis protein